MDKSFELKKPLKHIAQAGYIAKGIVYLLLGFIAFLAASKMGGQSTNNASNTGVFAFIKESPGGVVLLILLASGLVCYVIRRMQQTFSTEEKEKKFYTRIRYFLSGMAYLALAYSALKFAFSDSKDKGNQNQELASMLLQESYGQWLVGAAAAIFAAIGIYQIWYGLSEKYKKHVQDMKGNEHAGILMKAGKIGYSARGIVWLLVAFMLFRAALHSASSQAGDTSDAFKLFQNKAGTILTAILGLGLMIYGIFNFIRAKYERF